MAVDAILGRLSRVKASGRDKWLACCPAHEDQTPSLAIRELDDGRVLVHCFGGCSALDVVESLGLDMADLFPERLGDFKPVSQPFSAADVLRALTMESRVIAIAAADIADGKTLGPDDAQRALVAADRISDALSYINGR
jgi:hypothetical protein